MLKEKKNFKKIKEVYSQLQNVRAQNLKIMQAAQQAAQQVEQKKSFDDFKKQLTVRDLPANLQRRAYNEYTSKE